MNMLRKGQVNEIDQADSVGNVVDKERLSLKVLATQPFVI